MIKVEALTRYYGAHPALQDVSLNIQDGEIIGFLGLNGAGKSTLLKVLAGLLMPSAGRVTIGGTDAGLAPDALRRKIGFLPEDPPLYREMRVRDFLLWCGEIKGLPRSEVHKELSSVCDTCQLTHVADQVISTLSHGYRKRVGIAQAIIHRPDLVILDEPISGLDPQQIYDMRAVVKKLRTRSTVLLSSHILSEISQTCDRILVLHKGRLVAEGSEQSLASRLSSTHRIVLVLRGSQQPLQELLASSPHVESSKLSPGEPGLVEAEVSLNGDCREELIATLVGAGFGIRKIGDAEPELEQIFLGLTGEPKSDTNSSNPSSDASPS